MVARRQVQQAGSPSPDSVEVGVAVLAAIRRGLVVGRPVTVGVIPGVVIGYNIARRGRYRGARYPLLVETALGVAKCGVAEVTPA